MLPFAAAVAAADVREVERLVMEDGADPCVSHVGDEPCPRREVGEAKVEHVGCVLRFRGNRG
jgi:hypothetical protein